MTGAKASVGMEYTNRWTKYNDGKFRERQCLYSKEIIFQHQRDTLAGMKPQLKSKESSPVNNFLAYTFSANKINKPV